MAHGFSRRHDRYVARLDEQERAIVAGLMDQVIDLIGAEVGDERAEEARESGTEAGAGGATEGTFEEIVSGLGGLGGLEGVGERDHGPDAPEALGGRGFGAAEPRDPALDRLFPTGNREDEQAAAEFRRLTEAGLRARTSANLEVAVRALQSAERDRVELTISEAQATMVALTDVRLVLGERLGLRTDEDADRVEELVQALDPDDPLVYALAVYDFLTWLQETLVQAMLA